jgi:large subunit ribosomal protein L10
MDRKQKEKLVNDLHGRLEKAQGTFLVDYKGLNVEAMNRLRKELKKADAEFRIVKNRLLRLASQGTSTALIQDHMKGPSALAITYEDLVSPAKVLVDFAKDFDQLEIKGGQISDKLVDAKAIRRLAELPGRDVLLAQALSAMQAVPASLVRVLNGVLAQLLNVLMAIQREREQGTTSQGAAEK